MDDDWTSNAAAIARGRVSASHCFDTGMEGNYVDPIRRTHDRFI